MISWDSSLIYIVLSSLLGPLVVGVVIWWLGKNEIERRVKNEAIRDLMTFRGDYASPEFRRSFNKVSITFHKDEEIRQQIRDLYEDINNPNTSEPVINRKIVGLIYNLCQKNGFEGITEYDIDQSLPEQRQTPSPVIQSATLTPTSKGKQPSKVTKKARNRGK